MRKFVLPLALLLNACAPVTPLIATTEAPTRADTSFAKTGSGLPPMKTFGAPQNQPTQISNNDLALDVMELSFQLESGRELPILTRFEHPISVRVTGRPPASLGPDLTKLIYRLQSEAGIDISRTNRVDANITIEAVSRADIRRALPKAACFVVPNISSIREYKSARRTPKTNWTLLKTREKLAIFLPNDASPQEVRDCLHEELAQAIGPLNDLYRLPDSVFNDDNVHTVLTGFDMMVLRAYYDPTLRSGMTRGQVASRLPSILARINPVGENLPGQFTTRTPRAWSQAVQTALGPGATTRERRAAVTRALEISTAMGWQDHRAAFAHYAAGRLAQLNDPKRAQAHFQQADAYYSRARGTSLHRAYVATQLAAHAISEGDGERALLILNKHIDVATKGENAALLSTLLLLQAEALDLTGEYDKARSVRLDSLGWARYGFGPDWAVRAKLREISALNPSKGQSG
ncbi:MAG: DUF2927 domain-containing protein [Aliishimia sp.]